MTDKSFNELNEIQSNIIQDGLEVIGKAASITERIVNLKTFTKEVNQDNQNSSCLTTKSLKNLNPVTSNKDDLAIHYDEINDNYNLVKKIKVDKKSDFIKKPFDFETKENMNELVKPKFPETNNFTKQNNKSNLNNTVDVEHDAMMKKSNYFYKEFCINSEDEKKEINKTKSCSHQKQKIGDKLIGRNVQSLRNFQPKQNKSSPNRRKKNKKSEHNINKDFENGLNLERIAKKQASIVLNFNEEPMKRPHSICFDFPGVDLTHYDIKAAIERVLPNSFSHNLVSSIQFENRSIKHGIKDLMNRWHVQLKNAETADALLKSGLVFYICNNSENPRMYTEKVNLKLYDSVMADEYKRYLMSVSADEKLQTFILRNTGSIDKCSKKK